jgi:phosphatidylserine/phosphatidylglycerophosphate/cardiolipin synthase-like enzyme
MSRRVIRKSSRYCDLQAADLLQSLFVVELVCPSRVLWLVSAWVSDVPVVDNSAGGFVGIDPAWDARQIRLSELLVALAARGTQIVVAANTDDHNRAFAERLHSASRQFGVDELVQVGLHPRLHAKGLLGDDYHLHGSMNFTHNGLRILTEELVLELDPDYVQRTRLDYLEWFGPARTAHG